MSLKKIFVALSLLLCCLTASAYDVIVKNDGTSLMGKVVEISDTEVKYRRADNPDGPIYTLKVADIMRINYENGQSDLMQKDGMTPSSVLSGPTGTVNDTNLWKMYKKNQTDYSLPKKLKLTAFIGGGTLIAAGAVMMILSYGPSEYPELFFSGVAAAGLGAVWMPTFYSIARRKQKQIEEMELVSAPLYRQEIFEKGGTSLSIGVDYMANKVNTRTLGFGMTFNF